MDASYVRAFKIERVGKTIRREEFVAEKIGHDRTPIAPHGKSASALSTANGR